MQTRDRLNKAAVKYKSPTLMRSYRKARNATNTLNSQLEKKHYNDKITACKGDIKGSWRAINEIINKKSKSKILIISRTVVRKSPTTGKLQM